MRSLFIATAGGHLTQLMALSARLPALGDDALWVTVPTAQSRSLLAGRDVIWAEYGRPRDLRALAAHYALARTVVRRERFAVALSTGASLAPPFLAAARSRRIPCHYIESATRVAGPSLAGRAVSRLPGIHLYTQHEIWADHRWAYRGSVFDGWRATPVDPPRPIERAVVTAGSARGFPFRRLLEAARRVLPPDCAITWQTGEADVVGLRGRVAREFSAGELGDAISTADVIISHAGTGSAVAALEAGVLPILIPRLAERGEHVDDHQTELAAMLNRRGLAIVRTPEDLTEGDLQVAAGTRIAAVQPEPFRLVS